MAIVINVPRDERFGDLGSAGGKLLGTMIQKRRDDKDASLIAGVRSGEDAGAALGQVSPKNRAAVNAADAAFRAENPKETLLTIDEGGRATGSRQGRDKQKGETSLAMAQFNRARAGKATDNESAINEILVNQVQKNPAFSGKTNLEKKQGARNIREIPKARLDIKATLATDKIGELTGDSKIKLSRFNKYLIGYLNGTEGKPLVLSAAVARQRATRDAARDVVAFNNAIKKNSLLTPDEFFNEPIVDPTIEEPVTEPDTTDAAAPFKDLLSGFADNAAGLFQEQEPITTDTDIQVLDPAIRVEEATQLAIDSNYPVQDNEEWVEVSDGLPLVPQSMMDMASEGFLEQAAESYSIMSGLNIIQARNFLEANMHKAPMPTILKTKVIPDPISDPVVAPAPASNTGIIQR